MKKPGWSDPFIAVAICVSVACIIAGWSYLQTIAGIFLSAALAMAMGAGAIGLYWLAGIARNEWLKGQTLQPDSELGNYPVRITKGGIIQPLNTSKEFLKVTNYSPRMEQLLEREKQTMPIQELLQPPTRLQLPEHINLMNALDGLQLNPLEFEFYLGEAETGPIVYKFGPDILHVGNLGATGSGKSSNIQSILFQLALHDPAARRIKFAFVDFKTKTARPFAKAPQTLAIAQDPQEARKVIELLTGLLKERERQPGERLKDLPIVVLILEEFLDLREELDPVSWQRIISLATGGRHGKIYLMALSQTFYSSQETRTLKGQLRTRNAFRVEDWGTLRSFGFNDPAAIELLKGKKIPGRFLHRGDNGIVLAQSPYIEEQTIVDYFSSIAPQTRGAARPGVSSEEWESPQVATYRELKPGDPELLKAYTAYNQGATSIIKLAAALGVTAYRAGQLMERLQNEGWITKRGRGNV